MKYVFVEGLDDANLISELIKGKDDIKVIEYSGKKKEKINGMIRTFNKMNNKYVLLADMDEKTEETRKKELKKIYKDIDDENIFFAIQEIEAWYLAGISDNNSEKYKINNKLLSDTQNITKESFEKIFQKSRETLSITKLRIISEFDIDKSVERNNSLKIFMKMLNDCFS